MILSDKDIKNRIRTDNLLEFHTDQNIKYCGYELTIAKVVEPDTGKVLWAPETPKGRIAGIVAAVAELLRPSETKGSGCFILEPSDTVIVVTKEKLNMPSNLCATYGQLNRLSNRGLLILNTSIVEPGYKGPLSCVLVNFSSQRHALTLGESIAKLNFHELKSEPDELYKDSFTHQQYEQVASKNATSLPKSLLDISGVEKRVADQVSARFKRDVVLAGVIILFLLTWSQLEAFFSGWIYDKTGIMSTTKQVEIMLQQQRIEYQDENMELRRLIADLQNRLGQTTAPTNSPR